MNVRIITIFVENKEGTYFPLPTNMVKVVGALHDHRKISCGNASNREQLLM